jgi:hypothetical protein
MLIKHIALRELSLYLRPTHVRRQAIWIDIIGITDTPGTAGEAHVTQGFDQIPPCHTPLYSEPVHVTLGFHEAAAVLGLDPGKSITVQLQGNTECLPLGINARYSHKICKLSLFTRTWGENAQ